MSRKHGEKDDKSKGDKTKINGKTQIQLAVEASLTANSQTILDSLSQYRIQDLKVFYNPETTAQLKSFHPVILIVSPQERFNNVLYNRFKESVKTLTEKSSIQISIYTEVELNKRVKDGWLSNDDLTVILTKADNFPSPSGNENDNMRSDFPPPPPSPR